MFFKKIITPTLKLIDLPEIQRLEDLILLENWRKDELPIGSDEYVDEVSRENFGISEFEAFEKAPTFYKWGDKYSDDLSSIPRNESVIELEFFCELWSDDEIAERFLPVGIDFRNRYDQPMKSTPFICFQVEAAYRGIAGELPTAANIKLDKWQNDLAAEANAFKKKQPKSA